MIEACCLLALLSPFIYLITTTVVYVKKKEARGFIQMVILPLPFLIIIGFIIFESYEDPDRFEMLVKILTGASMIAGLGILVHQLLEKDTSRFSLLTRLPASILLLTTPILMFFPEVFARAAPVCYVIIGSLLGIYGYINYYKGRKIGLVYAYLAIMFFILAPVVSLVISYIYFDMIKENVVYRRAYWGDVSCHDIGIPFIFVQEEFIKPVLFGSGYIGLIGVVAMVRKYLLKRKLTKDGTIPKEYFDALEEGKDA